MLVPILCLSKILSIAAQDAIEYAFFNRTVYIRHNFPDIRRKRPGDCGVLDAAISGAQCCWRMYLPLAIVYAAAPRLFKNALLYTAILGLQFAVPILSMVFDRVFQVRYDMFKYHKWMYSMGFLGEATYLVLTVIMAAML